MKYSGQAGPKSGTASPNFKPYWPLLAPLTLRSLTLLLPHTYFQPDEFYQALEPAHWLVYGYGYLTWEWRDLAIDLIPRDGWKGIYDEVVIKGRMRSWLWPSVFAGVYEVLRVTGQERFIAIAPRLVGILVAALTDFGTYKLAVKLLGSGAGPTALLLSMCSLFNGHALTRALSTSPETLLTVWALVFFPLPPPTAPSRMIVGEKHLVASRSMQDVKKAKERIETPVAGTTNENVLRVEDVAGLDFGAMDRMPPLLGEQEPRPYESLALSAALATLAICIRPTTVPFWVSMGLMYIWRNGSRGVFPAASAIAASAIVLAASTTLDYMITRRFLIPILTFAHYNLFNPIAAFYGETKWWYHITQTIPILAFPLTILDVFIPYLLPSRLAPKWERVDSPEGLLIISRAMFFAIATLSLSTHSEWRFLHPFLPTIIVMLIPVIFKAYTPTILGAYKLVTSVRQYFRMKKSHFYLVVSAPIIPLLYLNTVHGRAQVEVMNVLRRGELGEVTGLVVLMPCHAVPWMSHLHKDVPGWFLTCEPPVNQNRTTHITQQSVFYADPAEYIRNTFPNPPRTPADAMSQRPAVSEMTDPSHVLLFGQILNTVSGPLKERGYKQIWHGWNGFDFAQDEKERKGGVRVWRRSI